MKTQIPLLPYLLKPLKITSFGSLCQNMRNFQKFFSHGDAILMYIRISWKEAKKEEDLVLHTVKTAVPEKNCRNWPSPFLGYGKLSICFIGVQKFFLTVISLFCWNFPCRKFKPTFFFFSNSFNFFLKQLHSQYDISPIWGGVQWEVLNRGARV